MKHIRTNAFLTEAEVLRLFITTRLLWKQLIQQYELTAESSKVWNRSLIQTVARTIKH